MLKRKVFMIFLSGLLLLQACAGPASLQVVSIATMAITGKSVGDHMLSTATANDCAFFNLVRDEKLCINSDSAELLLLTSGQAMDDNLLLHRNDNYPANVPVNIDGQQEIYLVIGSFSNYQNAHSYQVKHLQWQSTIQQHGSGSKFRVLHGPVEYENVENLKQALSLTGIVDVWSIAL